MTESAVTVIRVCCSLIVVSLFATPARPCSIIGPVPAPQDLVQRADVIVRARAEGVAKPLGRLEALAASPAPARFIVVDVLKGELSAPSIQVNGVLVDRDDPNDAPVPYEFIRPAGRHGTCYALEYRAGAEYLLLLRRAEYSSLAVQPNELSPYWSPLAPTNEQLFEGARSPWHVWVTGHVKPGL